MDYRLGDPLPAVPVMPVSKRRGIVPQHGYCSGKPAYKYGEAMQLGSGVVSACVYGKPYREEIVYGHERLYFPTVEQVLPPPPLAGHMQEIRGLLKEGRSFEAADLASDIAREEGGHKGLLKKPADRDEWEMPVEGFQKHSGARLTICAEEQESFWDYLRTVDFMSGESSLYWTDRQGNWSHKGFVLRNESIHVQKIEIPQGVKAIFHLNLEPFSEYGEHEWERMSLPSEVLWRTQGEADSILFEGFYDQTISQEGYVAAVWITGQSKCMVTEDGTLTAEASEELMIYSTIRHFEKFGPGCAEKTLEEAVKAVEKRIPSQGIPFAAVYKKLLDENRTVHGRLMEASLLELKCGEDRLLTMEELLKKQHEGRNINQALMEKLYDGGRYFQVITTGELPPLIGQWNINVNLQVCSGNITGLQELMKPYFNFIEKNLPDFRRNAREIYGCQGIVADIHPDMHNGMLYHFSRTWPHEFYTAGTGWMYHEFYYYYLTTGDLGFLERHVVPGLKEIAAFYDGFLQDKDSDGNYIFYPCLSPENSPADSGPASINAVMDIMVCREVLENLLQAEDILGISDPQIDRWKDILAHLPTLLTDEEGGLKEWAWPAYQENYNHRCVSHHYDVWPGDKINFEDSPEAARAVWISNRKRPLENDSCHGIMHRLFTAVRLEDREYAERLLHMLLEAGFVNCNMTTNHYPYRVVFPDMLGSMPAVEAELLVYSKPGRIRLLPGADGILPAGKVEGLWLYTFIRLDYLEWDLVNGWMKAEFVSLTAQEVAVESAEEIVSCRVNGEEMMQADGKQAHGGTGVIWADRQLVLSLEKGQSVCLEARFAAGEGRKG